MLIMDLAKCEQDLQCSVYKRNNIVAETTMNTYTENN
jgi:hypothetical protein